MPTCSSVFPEQLGVSVELTLSSPTRSALCNGTSSPIRNESTPLSKETPRGATSPPSGEAARRTAPTRTQALRWGRDRRGAEHGEAVVETTPPHIPDGNMPSTAGMWEGPQVKASAPAIRSRMPALRRRRGIATRRARREVETVGVVLSPHCDLPLRLRLGRRIDRRTSCPLSFHLRPGRRRKREFFRNSGRHREDLPTTRPPAPLGPPLAGPPQVITSRRHSTPINLSEGL